MNTDFDTLKKEYQELISKTNRLRESLVEQIGMLFLKNDLTLGVPMESRVKPWSSIEEKVFRKSLDIKSITQLTDLVGIRAIFLFQRDLLIAENLLTSTFNVVSAEDTGLRLAEAQFGYQSRHYIVQLPSDWLTIPSFSELSGLQAEIQVRTLAQHIWAAVSHKLQYKQERNVPPPIRRTMYRVSALLETVDLEFQRVLDERQHYEKEIVTLESTEPLNVDLVKSILSELLPADNEQQPENYSALLAELLLSGIKTAGDLRELIQQNLEAILHEDATMVAKNPRGKEYSPFDARKGINRDVFFTHVGLVRQALEIRDRAIIQKYHETQEELLTHGKTNG